VDDPLRVT